MSCVFDGYCGWPIAQLLAQLQPTVTCISVLQTVVSDEKVVALTDLVKKDLS